MLTRSLSILIMVPPFLWLVLHGGAIGLYLLALPVVAVMLWEWQRLQGSPSWSELLPAIIGGWLILTVVQGLGARFLPALLSLLFGLALSLGVFVYRPGRSLTNRIMFLFAGMVYCTLPIALLLDLRGQPFGEWWLLYLLAVIWATDIGAYLFGRLLGRRKLAPAISPGKTWAGVVGGTTMAVLVGLVALDRFSLAIPFTLGIFLTISLSLFGQIGDLAESLMKREADIKDASSLIPGHGGLLDRLDSLLFAAPLLVCYRQITEWMGS